MAVNGNDNPLVTSHQVGKLKLKRRIPKLPPVQLHSSLENSMRNLASDMKQHTKNVMHIASYELSKRNSRIDSAHDSAKNLRTVKRAKDKIYHTDLTSERNNNHLSSLSRYQMYDAANSKLATGQKKFNIRKIKQLQQRRERQLERSKMKKLSDLQTDPLRSLDD